MKHAQRVPLNQYTSLAAGGKAEELITCTTSQEIVEAVKSAGEKPVWLLGYGCNVLIADAGLPGATVLIRSSNMSVNATNLLITDAGVWWDDLVKLAIENRLWGLELMSEIPSSVGGAVHGNIAAYGQQVSDALEWVKVYDQKTGEIKKLAKAECEFSYRRSGLQSKPELIILRAAFRLSSAKLHDLRYDAALKVANDLGLDHDSLEHCRQIIVETRRRAGSIFHYDDPEALHTAGSFFKNPMVSTEQATELAKFDESGATLERIRNQSLIHGGDSHRASAAHVLLAAGFNRGQTWANGVRLHPSHVLKLENVSGSAQAVYDVAMHIVSTVKAKTGIALEPEVKFLGNFQPAKTPEVVK